MTTYLKNRILDHTLGNTPYPFKDWSNIVIQLFDEQFNQVYSESAPPNPSTGQKFSDALDGVSYRLNNESFPEWGDQIYYIGIAEQFTTYDSQIEELVIDEENLLWYTDANSIQNPGSTQWDGLGRIIDAGGLAIGLR